MRTADDTVRARGFTLIEMMVVLGVMGLCVALAMVAARPDDRAEARVEAQRLAAVLDIAAATARMSGTSLAWTADGAGYRFWRLDARAGWREIAGDELLKPRALPSGVTLSDVLVEQARPHTPRVEFRAHAPTPLFSMRVSVPGETQIVAAGPLGVVRAANAKEQFRE
jgi:general secretion pathway protein H